MPGQIRPNNKAAKIVYTIMQTPKNQQQRTQKKPSEKLLKQWRRDSTSAQ
jgi:hypothetical protein